MNYYVDSVYGCDKADGTSRQTAWRTLDAINSRTFKGGDKILLKAGCTFNGNLSLKREQSEGTLVLGRYGAGEKPEVIAEAGCAIDLVNVDNIEIFGLSLTAPTGLRGISVQAYNSGALKNIYIHNCRIHDVNNDRHVFNYESGGIIFISGGPDTPSWFDDVTIEDNEITDVGRTGILHTNLWACRPQMWGFNKYGEDPANWWPSNNMQVRGNYIDRTGGDGIVLLGNNKAVIEWNTVYHVMTNPCPPCANAGIWPQSANDTLIQYNEVGYCNKPEGCNDAQGYDVDLSCRDTVIQYNYSHDNGGGFLLLCENGSTTTEDNYRGTVVRNNLSVNDGNIKGELIAMVGPVRGVTIENNTIYSSGNVDKVIEVWTADGENQAKDVRFRNNLVISNGRDNNYHLVNGENFVFENNVYWGTHTTAGPDEVGALVADPRLAKSGAYGDGRLVLENYAPANADLFAAAATPIAPAEKDLLGTPNDGKAYVGAIRPTEA